MKLLLSMYTHKSIIALLLMVMLNPLTSYSQPSDTHHFEFVEPHVLNISVKEFHQNGDASRLFKLKSIVPLQTNDKSLIGRITKVIATDEYYFVFDRKNQKLLQFSKSGKFYRQIGQRGKGPGEYYAFLDFDIDESTQQIYLLDIRSVHLYDFTGSLIKTHRTDFFASTIHRTSSEGFLLCGVVPHKQLLSTSLKFRLKEQYFDQPQFQLIKNSYPFSKYRLRSVIHLPLRDTVFSLINGQLSPLFYINLNGKNFTISDYDRLPATDRKNLHSYLNRNNNYANCEGFLPCKEYVYLSIVYSNNSYIGLYNLDNDNYFLICIKELENDIFDASTPFYPVGVTSQTYILSVPSHLLIKNKSSQFYKNNKNKLDMISEFSNPTLVFIEPIL